MSTAVYVVGGQRDHEELRYSLRSLANAPFIKNVWVLGEVPDWVQNVRKLPVEPLSEKFANIRNQIEVFAGTKGAPRKFYFFNEDHYIIEPIEGELPVYHLGDGREYITGTREFKGGRNTWAKAVMNSVEWLEENGHPSVAYLAHSPLFFDRTLLREALEAYPSDRTLDVPMLYNIAGIGGEGVNAGNAKVQRDEEFELKNSLNMPYISGNQNTFNSVLGTFLKTEFPSKSRFEV